MSFLGLGGGLSGCRREPRRSADAGENFMLMGSGQAEATQTDQRVLEQKNGGEGLNGSFCNTGKQD